MTEPGIETGVRIAPEIQTSPEAVLRKVASANSLEAQLKVLVAGDGKPDFDPTSEISDTDIAALKQKDKAGLQEALAKARENAEKKVREQSNTLWNQEFDGVYKDKTIKQICEVYRIDPASLNLPAGTSDKLLSDVSSDKIVLDMFHVELWKVGQQRRLLDSEGHTKYDATVTESAKKIGIDLTSKDTLSASLQVFYQHVFSGGGKNAMQIVIDDLKNQSGSEEAKFRTDAANIVPVLASVFGSGEAASFILICANTDFTVTHHYDDIFTEDFFNNDIKSKMRYGWNSQGYDVTRANTEKAGVDFGSNAVAPIIERTTHDINRDQNLQQETLPLELQHRIYTVTEDLVKKLLPLQSMSVDQAKEALAHMGINGDYANDIVSNKLLSGVIIELSLKDLVNTDLPFNTLRNELSNFLQDVRPVIKNNTLAYDIVASLEPQNIHRAKIEGIYNNLVLKDLLGFSFAEAITDGQLTSLDPGLVMLKNSLLFYSLDPQNVESMKKVAEALQEIHASYSVLNSVDKAKIPNAHIPTSVQDLLKVYQENYNYVITIDSNNNAAYVNELKSTNSDGSPIEVSPKQVVEMLELIASHAETSIELSDPTSWASIEALATSREIANKEVIQKDLDAAMEAVRGQSGIVEIKTVDDQGNAIPTIVIPDLHARRDMLYTILKDSSGFQDTDGRDLTIYEALQQGAINIVLLGDLIHSERDEVWKSDNEKRLIVQLDTNGFPVFDARRQPILTEYGKLVLQRRLVADDINSELKARALQQKVSLPDDVARAVVNMQHALTFGSIDQQDPEYHILQDYAQAKGKDSEWWKQIPVPVVTDANKDPQVAALDNQLRAYKLSPEGVTTVNEAKEKMMNNEMVDELGLMQMIWRLQAQHPENFKVILGTHDDVSGTILNARKMGAHQTDAVQNWMNENGYQDVLSVWEKYALQSPLVVKGKGMIASHTTPGKVYAKETVEERNPQVVRQFIYNREDSDLYPTADVAQQWTRILEFKDEGKLVWFNGHDDVHGVQEEDWGSIQRIIIDDGNNYIYAVFPGGDRPFDKDRDIHRPQIAVA